MGEAIITDSIAKSSVLDELPQNVNEKRIKSIENALEKEMKFTSEFADIQLKHNDLLKEIMDSYINKTSNLIDTTSKILDLFNAHEDGMQIMRSVVKRCFLISSVCVFASLVSVIIALTNLR